MFQAEMIGEVVGDVIGIAAGERGANGTHHFLRHIRVLTSHVLTQGLLREAQFGTERTRVGLGRIQHVGVMGGRGGGAHPTIHPASSAQGRGLAPIKQLVIGPRQDTLHRMSVGVAGRGHAILVTRSAEVIVIAHQAFVASTAEVALETRVATHALVARHAHAPADRERPKDALALSRLTDGQAREGDGDGADDFAQGAKTNPRRVGMISNRITMAGWIRSQVGWGRVRGAHKSS